MKKLTITLILLLSLAVARAQEVVDYGITINVFDDDYRNLLSSVKVTSENCTDVLKEVIENDGNDSHQEVVYAPETNTLYINSEKLQPINSYYFDLIVEPSRPNLSVVCLLPDRFGYHHLRTFNAPQSDITFSMESKVYDTQFYFETRSLTLTRGYYPLVPQGTIRAQKLVLEPGCNAVIGGAQSYPPLVDTLIVDHAGLLLGTMCAPENYEKELYIALQGSSVVSPECTYDSVQHRLCFLENTSYEIHITVDGDMNDDAQIDVADVNILIDVILGRAPDGPTVNNVADLNHDGKVDVADVSLLIDMILGKTE